MVKTVMGSFRSAVKGVENWLKKKSWKVNLEGIIWIQFGDSWELWEVIGSGQNYWNDGYWMLKIWLDFRQNFAYKKEALIWKLGIPNRREGIQVLVRNWERKMFLSM